MPATKKRASELDKLIERAATDKERIILRRGRKRATGVPIEDLEAIARCADGEGNDYAGETILCV